MSIKVTAITTLGLDGDVTAHLDHEIILPSTVSAHFSLEKAIVPMSQLRGASSRRTHPGDLQPARQIPAEGESCVKSRTKQKSGLHQG
jgi:hypothetical protein